MSVYNDAEFLEEAMSSIVKQTFEDYYFFIIDDCSTDGSYDILKSFESLDNRIKVFRNKKNRGLPYSLNKLIGVSRTEILARMDADDISRKDRLELQYKKLTSTNADILWSNAVFIDENSDAICQRYQPSEEFSFNYLEYFNFLVHPSVMFTREAVVESGMYDKNLKYGQDYDLWKRMKKRGYNFSLLDKPLIYYRIKENSNTAKFFNLSKNKHKKYAKICLKNREYEKFWDYFIEIGNKNLGSKIYLVLRYLTGEDLILFLRFLKQKYRSEVR